MSMNKIPFANAKENREGIKLPPFWCHIGAIKIKYQITII
jgi:hypothetical protein